MLEPSLTPRLYALPPGADLARAVAAGVRRRLAGAPPEAAARVEIIANAMPTLTALRAAFAEGPPALLPRLRTLDALRLRPVRSPRRCRRPPRRCAGGSNSPGWCRRR